MHKLLWAEADAATPRQEAGKKPRANAAPGTGDPPHPRSAQLSAAERQTWGARDKDFTSNVRLPNSLDAETSQSTIPLSPESSFPTLKHARSLALVIFFYPRLCMRPCINHIKKRIWGFHHFPPERTGERKGSFPTEETAARLYPCVGMSRLSNASSSRIIAPVPRETW